MDKPRIPSRPAAGARAAAAAALARAESGGTFIDEAVAPLREALPDARDRGLLTTLAFGVMRWRRPLDWLIDACAKRVDSELRQHLRVALFQVRYLDRVPRHAAVNEAVELAKAHGQRASGFVNAVLRRASDLALPDDLGVVTSHPDWLIDRWRPRVPDLRALLDANNAILPITARVNPLRRAHEHTTDVIELDGDPSALPAFVEGRLTVQDETFTRVAPMLDPRPHERVLDLCAAPGGKTTHLAELMGGQGTVVAVDRPDRIGLIEESARRLGLGNVRALAGDATTIDFPEPFAAVLLDAPCSNTGVLARRPDARWRLRPRDIAANAALQQRLLANAWRLVAPGGRLLYVTCSLEPEEHHVDLPGMRVVSRELVLPTARASGGSMTLVVKA